MRLSYHKTVLRTMLNEYKAADVPLFPFRLAVWAEIHVLSVSGVHEMLWRGKCPRRCSYAGDKTTRSDLVQLSIKHSLDKYQGVLFLISIILFTVVAIILILRKKKAVK